jgi:hypothetical protein
MADLTREQMEALGKVFNTFALDDQRNYYRSAVTKYRRSASQVNLLRAAFSFLTGLASALAGLLVLGYLPDSGQCLAGESTCRLVGVVVFVLLVIAIVAPVLGGAFSNLADLFQWDRLVNVYSTALENIEVADALSPDPEMDETKYRASYTAYTSGTLQVMRDESAQWGQLIRTPAQIETFLAEEIEKAEKISRSRSARSRDENPGG